MNIYREQLAQLDEVESLLLREGAVIYLLGYYSMCGKRAVIGEWESESEQWVFAVDYIGHSRTTNIGIISKPKVGSGLLYNGDNGRVDIRLVSLLDNHKWVMR